MSNNWVKSWDDRYSKEEFVYGEEPNNFLREQLQKLKPGKILFPAEGEGRNAVFAATKGWDVYAFDISSVGKHKAEELAKKNNVKIKYEVGGLQSLNYKPESFDVIALIYAHFPAEIKSEYHKTLGNYLKKGGIIIFEAFSKKHLEYISRNESVGGPREIEMLFSKEEIQSDFNNFEIIELDEKVIQLNEGSFHNGEGSVIRFIGRKNM
ncbi:MAG: class I SAM-dependent methyltransferase [Bacteroidetes bacterium]|nr:class I SAM-dependent methyltransferase [Bacteroidota bacterium]MBK9414435.1 class I SAM-dependent methyltransferase [Bacteroidota bacterium]MBP6427778.1 class I SAM-dependent methyltransferase [Bacteroidia bacterium]